ncbi:unnamed protein product [Gongylonema pulchrum]|uniref:PABS domain-containing protein n=1 Tax=Gongylonema pulchrum TaxID=637853 RepID=A0A3P7M936_9BILA|nr:unnamed protein product [Gongylonema pulchrum]
MIAGLDTLLLPVNHSRLVNSYIQPMITLTFASGTLPLQNGPKMLNILSIGLGTGILNSFLHDNFSNLNITVVEIDPKIYELSKKYFGLTEDSRQRIILADALKYLQQLSSQSKYDVIYIDPCYNKQMHGLVCPIEAFTQKRNLQLAKQALPKTGLSFSFFHDLLNSCQHFL